MFQTCLTLHELLIISHSTLLASPPVWLENGSCHHPLLQSDAEYLLNNTVAWHEILKSFILFVVSFFIILTNLVFMFSLNVVTNTK